MVFRFTSLVLMSALALASWTRAASVRHKETLRGYLVDLVCMKEEAGKISDFGEKHTKKCLQMPVCSLGGYALLLPSKEVIPFDDHGNDLARKLLATRSQEKDFVIKATGTRQENTFHVLRLE
jgi:hypothetical protein